MSKKIKLGIIGGEGAPELLESFLEIGEVNIGGILDQKKNTLFMRLGKKWGVFNTTVPEVFLRRVSGMLIVDFSNGWYKKIVPNLDGEVKIVGPDISALLFSCIKDRRRLLRTQSALQRISEIIVSTFDINRILNFVIHIASRLMKVEICSLRLISDKGKLKMVASCGLSRRYLGKGDLKIGKSVAGWVVKNKKPYFSTNLKKDPLYDYSSFARREGISSLLCVPLSVKEKVIGSLSVYTSSPRVFTPGETRLFTTFANQVAIVVENARLFKEVEESYLGLLEALNVVVETRDFYTANHSHDVRKYALAIAEKMGVTSEEKEAISYASLLHDLGKIGIEERILDKPEKLTSEEFEKIATHSKIGADIVSHIKILKHLAPLILHLHERYNGKGYPDGLKGKSISLGSRILMVADAFSAMTSDRPYRKALLREEAISELKKNRGSQFDPEVVDAFLSVLSIDKY